MIWILENELLMDNYYLLILRDVQCVQKWIIKNMQINIKIFINYKINK